MTKNKNPLHFYYLSTAYVHNIKTCEWVIIVLYQMSNLSAILWQEQVIIWWNYVWFILDQYTELDVPETYSSIEVVTQSQTIYSAAEPRGLCSYCLKHRSKFIVFWVTWSNPWSIILDTSRAVENRRTYRTVGQNID
jgi:hypothetical protein